MKLEDVHKTPEKTLSKVHKAQGSPLYQFGAPQEEESAETEKFKGNKSGKGVAFFPDELYDRLPEVEYLGVEVLGGGFAQGGKAVEVFFPH